MKGVKTIIDEKSYFIQYNNELILDGSKTTNIFGYVSFNEDDSDIDSIENQINIIIHDNYFSNKNVFRIYVDTGGNTLGLKYIQKYIDDNVLKQMCKKISINVTDMSRLLHFDSRDINNILDWVKDTINLRIIMDNSNIKKNDKILTFKILFNMLEYQRDSVSHKKKFVNDTLLRISTDDNKA